MIPAPDRVSYDVLQAVHLLVCRLSVHAENGRNVNTQFRLVEHSIIGIRTTWVYNRLLCTVLALKPARNGVWTGERYVPDGPGRIVCSSCVPPAKKRV